MENTTKTHSVTIENRRNGSLGGVKEVLSSSTDALSLDTTMGKMSVLGKDLKIKRFNDLDGTLIFSGEITTLRYEGEKIPFLKRIFK